MKEQLERPGLTLLLLTGIIHKTTTDLELKL